jgi:N-acetylglucosaminyl-diphospho-decaprenol L-rhamnosyltransferase
MLVDVEVPIVIVGFGNAADVVKCLTAIGKQRGCPRIGVFIENGGANAFYALIEALSSCGGPCAGDTENADLDAPIFLRIRRLRLAGVEIPVFIGQPKENLGFPGGVNSWLRLFLPERGWDGVWILNPDTWPALDGLTELIAFAVKRQKGMSRAGSCFPTVGHRFVARPQVA